jgi:hypothetical protein
MRLERFGIFAPILGVRQDFPVMLLTDAATPDAMNVRTYNGEIWKVKGYTPVLESAPAEWDADDAAAGEYNTGDYVSHEGTIYVSSSDNNASEPPAGDWAEADQPDATNPILHYHFLERSDGNAYLLAFSKNNVYLWDETQVVWRRLSLDGGNYTEATDWWTASVRHPSIGEKVVDTVVATNDADKVLFWDSATGDLDELDVDGGLKISGTPTYVTRAAFVVAFEGYTLVGNTIEGGGTYPSRLRWSAIGNPTDWEEATGGPGYVDVPGNDALTGAAAWGNYLYVFKERSVWRYWLVASDDVFNGELVSDAFGCVAAKTAVTDANGQLTFLATDGTIRTQDGQTISDPVSPILQQIPAGQASLARATRIDEYGETWLAIPYGGGATANNRVLTRNSEGAWDLMDFPIPAFGQYRSTDSLTIADLDDLFATIADWDWPYIGYVAADDGFAMDLASGSDGQTFQLHMTDTQDGETFSGYFSLATDLSEGSDLVTYKRVLHLRLYVRSETVSLMYVLVKRDEESSFQLIKRGLSLAGSGNVTILNVPCDIRARHFEFRILGASGPFRFLGMTVDFVRDGVA